MTYLLTLHDWLLYAPLSEVLSTLGLIGAVSGVLYILLDDLSQHYK